MTRLADLIDAPEYTRADGQVVRALRIDAVMRRDDGLFITLGDTELYYVPGSVAVRAEVGDYLVEVGGEDGQLIFEGAYFEEHFAPADEDDEVVTLIALGELNDRVTLEDIEGSIVAVNYLYQGTLTVCVLTLDNGYTVTGESACVDPANYDRSLGQKYAREAAIEKCWPLYGFLLAEMRYVKRLADDVECAEA